MGLNDVAYVCSCVCVFIFVNANVTKYIQKESEIGEWKKINSAPMNFNGFEI